MRQGQVAGVIARILFSVFILIIRVILGKKEPASQGSIDRMGWSNKPD
jgi:hypothetical protein